jgi:hypothetical protein
LYLCDLFSKNNVKLPAFVVCVLNNTELQAIRRRGGSLVLLVKVHIVSLQICSLFPIISKM